MHIAVLTYFLPWPLRSGGQTRQFHLLDAARRSHRLTLIVDELRAGTPAERAELAEAWPDVRIIPSPLATIGNPQPPSNEDGLSDWRLRLRRTRERLDPGRSMVRHYPSPATASAIHEVLAEGADLIQVEYVQMATYVPHQPRPKVVLVAYDVLARRAHRSRQVAGAARHVELGDWRARRHEAAAFRAADVVVVTGEHERPAALAAGARVVRVIPNGADDRLIEIPVGGRPGKLAFVGWGGHTPNRDGLSWWVEAVAPLIREDAVLTVAGDGWEDVRPDPHVRLFGYCADIKSLLTDAIVVLPLRVGGGVKLKTVEAMAAGRPIIATPVAIEGLPVRDGIEALVRDTPQGIASAVDELREDSELRRRLGEAARQAARPFLWSHVVHEMDKLYAEVLDQGGTSSDA